MRWLMNLLRRRQLDADLAEELDGYVALLEREHRSRGMPPEAARRAALMEAGRAHVREEAREARAGAAFESLLQDVRYGIRSLRRTPGFTAAAVLALGLGIGATAAIVSVIDGVLLRPLPYAAPERLMVVMHNIDDAVAPGNFLDWRRMAASFERMGGAVYWQPNLTGDRPEKILAVRVTSDVPAMLGVAPILGRLFTAAHDQSEARDVIISHALWQRLFAGDSAALGRTLTLDGQSYAVIGVMPEAFDFPPFWAKGAQLWAPLAITGEETTRRLGNYLRVFARLKPGVSVASARAEMDAITARLEQQFPRTNQNVTVTPLLDVVVGQVRPAIRLLFGAVLCVLLIACANVAHLLLARAAAREREMAVRLALGAGRGRVARQLLTESLLLALAGGAAGLLVAWGAVRALVLLSGDALPRVEAVGINGTVALATLAIAAMTGMLFGVAPSLRSGAASFVKLRDGARASGSTRRGRLRSILITSEFALALVLLAGAGLLVRSFIALRSADPGWDPSHLATAVVTVTGSADAEPGRRAVFFRRLVEEVERLPGVEAASAVNHLPVGGDFWGVPYNIEGREVANPGEAPIAAYRVVLPGYPRTMGIELVRGRDFTAGDDTTALPVVMVNRRLAERTWPGENPLGKRITLQFGAEKEWLTVVGVTADATENEWGAEQRDAIHFPYTQTRSYLLSMRPHHGYLTLVARTSGDPRRLLAGIRDAVWSLNRSAPVSDLQVMDDVVTRATARPRFYLVLLLAFAALAVSLAAVGIYGVISYQVTQRTPELGIRMALGASRGAVMRLVVGQGLRLAVLGAVVGLAGALMAARVMRSMLYGIGPTDVPAFATGALLLVLIAAAACAVPAWRASRIDPQQALRAE